MIISKHTCSHHRVLPVWRASTVTTAVRILYDIRCFIKVWVRGATPGPVQICTECLAGFSTHPCHQRFPWWTGSFRMWGPRRLPQAWRTLPRWAKPGRRAHLLIRVGSLDQLGFVAASTAVITGAVLSSICAPRCSNFHQKYIKPLL